MASGKEAHQYSQEDDADDEEDLGECDIVPSSQDTDGHASFKKELSSTGEKSSGEFYVPFSRGTFEDGFAELGSSQNFDLRMTESQDDCLLNTESVPVEDVNLCPSSSIQESPVGSPGGDGARTADSSSNVFVHESSSESVESPYTRVKGSSESLTAVPETEQEESNLIPDPMIAVTRQDSTDAQVVGSGPEIPVDLDDSSNSEDITIIQRGSESWRRKRAQESNDDTGGSGKKIRLANDESSIMEELESVIISVPREPSGEVLKLAEPEGSSSDVQKISEPEGSGSDVQKIAEPEGSSSDVQKIAEPEEPCGDVQKIAKSEEPSGDALESRPEEQMDPRQSRTLEVVDPEADDSNAGDGTHSKGTSCMPRVAYPYFVHFSVEVFNSVEQEMKHKRDYSLNGFELSARNFSLVTSKMSSDLYHWMSDNNIPMSPQSSLYLTTSSDDSLAYTADRSSSSSSSGLSGLSHIGGPLARSSILHGHHHDGKRISYDPRIGPPIITTDSLRRSDAASIGRCSYSSEFKKPDLPLYKRSSASSSSSSVDNPPVPPARARTRPSPLHLPDVEQDPNSRIDHAVESSTDLFDDQPQERALRPPVIEEMPTVEQQMEEEEEADTSRSSDAPLIIKGPGARDIDPDTRTMYSYVPDVPVYAKWKGDKFFYAGQIIGNKLSKEKYKVMFDDQSEADVLTRDVIMMELLPVGTSVYADPKGRGEYNGGYTILSHTDSVKGAPPHKSKGYVVRHQETRTELTLVRGRVSLSREAAQPLLLSYGAPQGSISAVSLDNIVTTKRKSKVKQLRDSWVVTPPSTGKRRATQGSPRSAKRPTSSEKGSPSSGRKSKKEIITPSATGSTLILEQEEQQSATASSYVQGASDTTNNSFSIYESETSFKQTGRFGSYESSRSSIGGPLFKNITFLITGSETPGVPPGRRTDSPSRRTSPTRRSTVSGQEVPFNRETLRSLIHAFGGQEKDVITERMLMEASDVTSTSKNRPCIFLIAPEPNRTSKYLQSLAANIPCIRYTWVHDSCREDALQPLSSYRLPRGFDILTQSIVPWNESLEGSGGANIFGSVIVAILTDDVATFGDVWERILTLGGAFVKVVPLASVHSTRLEKFHWLLYDDRQATTFNLEQLRGRPSICDRLIVPNFLIQCLLHARLFNPSENDIFTGKRGY